MPNSEIQQWLALIKDFFLALAALSTIVISIYGIRTWKRDLVGKEVYSAAKELVKESHLICRAAQKIREPVQTYERRFFTENDIQNTTREERWKISEIDAYKARVKLFSKEIAKYEAAKLDLRILVGSKIYQDFLPLGALLTETVNRVNSYLDVIESDSINNIQQSEEVVRAQELLYPSSM
ncbi:hypothetical protein, partial [Hydrogenovibrio marinus]